MNILSFNTINYFPYVKDSIMKVIASAILILSFGFINTAYAVNNVELPEPTGSVATNLQQLGRFSTLNYSDVGTFLTAFTSSFSVVNGRAYINMNNLCHGGILLPQNVPEQAGVLVLDVKDPANVQEVGRLPWSVLNPLTPPVKTQYDKTSTGAIKSAKLNSGDILAVEIDGDRCIPVFTTGGVNGVELWDVSDPDPAKAKFLSFFQVKDINLINAASDSNGRPILDMALFKKGNRDYIAVSINAAFLGTLQIYDITAPSSPQRVAFWGPELIAYPNVDLVNASSLTTPSLQVLNDYASTVDPKSFGYAIRKNFPGRTAQGLTVIDNGKKMYVGMQDAGLGLLDISNLNNIKVISVAIDQVDSARNQVINSTYAVESENGKTVVERTTGGPFFSSFTINDDPGFFSTVAEAAFTPRIISSPYNGTLQSSDTKYVGRACNLANVSAADHPGQIALVIRGVCAFQVKANNVIAKGYAAFITINTEATGNVATGQAGTSSTIPGVGIPYFTGLKMVDPAAVIGLTPPAVGQLYPYDLANLPLCDPASADANPALCNKVASGVTILSQALKWGHLRIWDYSNLNAPVLISTIDTFCSNHPLDVTCNLPSREYPPSGGKSIFQNGILYVPWESDGVLIVDLKNPMLPIEMASFKQIGEPFVSQNGGEQLMSEIAKDQGSGCIYALDINGGLYILDSVTTGPKCKVKQ